MNLEEDVFILICVECSSVLSYSGFRSTLLSDHYINVYSTNFFSDRVVCVYEHYISKKCKCAIKDIACSYCGLVVGYHVEQPCRRCLEEDNNGHMWMFSEERITALCKKDYETMSPQYLGRLGRKDAACDGLEPER